METEKYFSLQETARLLRISKSTLRNWDRKGIFVAYRNPINNYRLYKISQIENLLNRVEDSRKGKKFKIKVIEIEE